MANPVNKKEQEQYVSDEEKFEDATSKPSNDEIIEEIIESHTNLKLNDEDSTEVDKDAEENEKFVDCDNDFVDDESQRDFEKTLTEEERLSNKEKSEELKREGNELFKNGAYEKSIEVYTAGLRICPVDCGNERAILYANRAAAKSKLNFNSTAIDDCTKAIEFNSQYLKAFLRRAKLYEDTDKLDECLEDYKKIIELDGNNLEAKQALVRLPPKIQERNEKLKDEMMGKLKDLGNIILKPFGLSTNNFQMAQDPQTGGYSINFKQGS